MLRTFQILVEFPGSDVKKADSGRKKMSAAGMKSAVDLGAERGTASPVGGNGPTPERSSGGMEWLSVARHREVTQADHSQPQKC